MATPGDPLRKGSEDTGAARPGADLIRAAYEGNIDLARTALESGTPVATSDERTGLSALHIAVGTNNFPLCRLLIEEWHAPFGPDKFGRWPTLVAAECRASDELGDYIAEREAEFLRLNPS